MQLGFSNHSASIPVYPTSISIVVFVVEKQCVFRELVNVFHFRRHLEQRMGSRYGARTRDTAYADRYRACHFDCLGCRQPN
jgi:hypothetical protein